MDDPHELQHIHNVITAIIIGIVIMASSHFTLPFLVIATTLGSEADEVPEFYTR